MNKKHIIHTKKEALAAVTVPCGLMKAGFNFAIFSNDEALIPLSFDTKSPPKQSNKSDHSLSDILQEKRDLLVFSDHDFIRYNYTPGTLNEITSDNSPS